MPPTLIKLAQTWEIHRGVGYAANRIGGELTQGDIELSALVQFSLLLYKFRYSPNIG